MVENIRTTIQKANKDYHDDSSEFIINGFLDYVNRRGTGLTFTQWRTIANLKANQWKIKRGQIYERQFNKMDGRVYTFKTLSAIAAICQQFNLGNDIQIYTEK